MAVISIVTDFGWDDYEAGVLKGVIWRIAPGAKVADLTHDIDPQDVLSAALLLWRVVPHFPPDSIHLAVVDPGVGTARRAIAGKIDSQYFVGPDNGIFTLVIEQAEAKNELVDFVQLDRPEYWLPQVSSTFHGRDIFAPVAAYLANGVLLPALGTPIKDLIRLPLPQPTQTGNGWSGKVIHIDHFGNLSTNLNADQLDPSKEVIIHIKGVEMHGLVSTFGEKPAGSLVALLDSSGSLAISVVNGSAAHRLDAHIGDSVEVIIPV